MKNPLQQLWSRVAYWRGSADVAPASPNYGTAEPRSNGVSIDVEKKGEEGPQREQWSNPIEFLLSCVAMSVGLGNIWRFPFVAYNNGGGAFLIPYILVLFFIGKPLYYMELCLGQFASSGSVRVWDLCPAFRGVGYGQMLATSSVVTYYVVLMALTAFYFFASFQPVLPWAICGIWATDACVSTNADPSLFNVTGAKSSSDEYFNYEVLKIDPQSLDNGIGAPEWRLSLCLLFSWIVLFGVLVKGTASSGKAAYFTALFPYLVLFILLGRGASLEGASDGIIFFLTPQWHMLLRGEVWFAAVSQSFFSLSVGFGSIIMFASYNGFRHNVYRDAMIISITDTFTSILAGLTIFSILGHLAHQLGLPIDKVVSEGGTSLAFISYPDVLARFQVVPQLFSVLFFLMLFTLGVGSASALTGCVITIIADEFPKWNKSLITLGVCIVGFLLGLFYCTPQGQYILTLVDHYGGGFIIFILAAFEVIAVQWVYGVNNFCRDIKFMLQRDTGYYWKFCWAILIPVVLLFIFIYKMVFYEPLMHGSYEFGPNATAFGVLLTCLAIGMVPTFFGVSIWKNREKGDNWLTALKRSFQKTEDWRPKNSEDYILYQEFLANQGDQPSDDPNRIDDPKHDLYAMDNPVAVKDDE